MEIYRFLLQFKDDFVYKSKDISKSILFGIAKNRQKFCTKIYTPRLLAYARKSVDILVRFAGEECKHGYLRISSNEHKRSASG